MKGVFAFIASHKIVAAIVAVLAVGSIGAATTKHSVKLSGTVGAATTSTVVKPPPPPPLTLNVTTGDYSTTASRATISGQATGVQVTINGKPARMLPGGAWSKIVGLRHGNNTFTVETTAPGRAAVDRMVNVFRNLTAAERAAQRQAAIEKAAAAKAQTSGSGIRLVALCRGFVCSRACKSMFGLVLLWGVERVDRGRRGCGPVAGDAGAVGVAVGGGRRGRGGVLWRSGVGVL